MTERMYGGYPESCIREGLFQLEGEQVMEITRDLLADNAALREDAARYRWMRENISEDGQFFMVGRVLRSPEDFDAAIDKARTEGHSQGKEHKQGCPALGGYGTADRTCICEGLMEGASK